MCYFLKVVFACIYPCRRGEPEQLLVCLCQAGSNIAAQRICRARVLVMPMTRSRRGLPCHCTGKSSRACATISSKAISRTVLASQNANFATCSASHDSLREALKVLASEGLVDLLPNRGARVRKLSAQDLTELFDVMGGLEALAGRLACEGITDDEVAEIERLHHEMYGFYLRRNLHGYFQCNQLIHQNIVAAARNAALSSTYASFTRRIRRARTSANLDRKRDRWGEAMREHEAILDALCRRAGEELSDVLFRHLRNKRMAAIENIEAGASDR